MKKKIIIEVNKDEIINEMKSQGRERMKQNGDIMYRSGRVHRDKTKFHRQDKHKKKDEE